MNARLASTDKVAGASVTCEWLGRQPYTAMWRRLQEQAHAVAAGRSHEFVWSCEHEPVYTTGRRGIDNRLSTLPAPLVHTDRGGETTFHGPGQLMLYPIANLRRRRLGAKTYLHMIEQSCIDLLADFGLETCRRCGLPGVWIGGAKIAAVGLRIHMGVAYHGMALNVDVAPAWFAPIRPCGLSLPVTNLSSHVQTQTPPIQTLAHMWSGHLLARLEYRASARRNYLQP